MGVCQFLHEACLVSEYFKASTIGPDKQLVLDDMACFYQEGICCHQFRHKASFPAIDRWSLVGLNCEHVANKAHFSDSEAGRPTIDQSFPSCMHVKAVASTRYRRGVFCSIQSGSSGIDYFLRLRASFPVHDFLIKILSPHALQVQELLAGGGWMVFSHTSSSRSHVNPHVS